MPSSVHALLLFLHIVTARAGDAIIASTVAGQDVFLCASTNLKVPDMLYIVQKGLLIGNISLPTDFDKDGFKTTACADTARGLVVDPKRSVVYVAMANTNGQSSFGSSLVKVSMIDKKVTARLPMPQAHKITHEEFADAADMVLAGDDTLLISDAAEALHRVDLEKFSFVESMTVPRPQGAREGFYAVAFGLTVDHDSGFAYVGVSVYDGLDGGKSSFLRVDLQGSRMNVTSVLEVGEPLDDMFMVSNNTVFALESEVTGSPFQPSPAIPYLIKISVGPGGELKRAGEVLLWEKNKFYAEGGRGGRTYGPRAAALSQTTAVILGATSPRHIVPPTSTRAARDAPVTLLTRVGPLLGNATLADPVDFSRTFDSGLYNLLPGPEGTLLAIGSKGPTAHEPETLLELSMPDLTVIHATEIPVVPIPDAMPVVV